MTDAGCGAAAGAQPLDQVMRAADVGRECRFGRLPGTPDVGGPGAVIDDRGPHEFECPLDAAFVEQVHFLPVDAAGQPFGPGSPARGSRA